MAAGEETDVVQPTPDDEVMSKTLVAFTKAREHVHKNHLELDPPAKDESDVYTRAILAGIRASVLAVRDHDAGRPFTHYLVIGA